MYKFIPQNSDHWSNKSHVTKHYVLVGADSSTHLGRDAGPRPPQWFSVSVDVPNGNGDGVTRFSATDTWQELISMVLTNGAYMEHFTDQVVMITQPPIVQQLIHEVSSLANGVHVLQRELLGMHAAFSDLNAYMSHEIGLLKDRDHLGCGDAHSPKPQPEQPDQPVVKKTAVPCRHYARKKFCLYGDKCRFAHVDL